MKITSLTLILKSGNWLLYIGWGPYMKVGDFSDLDAQCCFADTP